jgi:hypothetical protein
MMRVISLGAGVQSTTLVLMAAHGEIGPMPDCAVFADTGEEPAPVTEHLRWLMSGNVLPFPVHIVGKPTRLGDDLMAGRNSGDTGSARRFASIPAFLKTDQDQGLGRRQCTKEYKLGPITKKLRSLLGYEPRKRIPKDSVEVWIGISTDEKLRVKPSRNTWSVNRYPLIEQRMSRGDCLEWLKRKGYPQPPKSACTFCPYRSNEEWRYIRDSDPAGFARAIEVDRSLRAQSSFGRSLRGEPYVHRSMVPLDQADISSDEDRGQINLFNNDCEGMCGV